MLLKEQEQLSTGKNTESYPVIRCERGVCRPDSHELIGEEPLLIRIDDKPYSVVMRTPGDELFQATGFCLGEGIVDTPDDFKEEKKMVEIRFKGNYEVADIAGKSLADVRKDYEGRFDIPVKATASALILETTPSLPTPWAPRSRPPGASATRRSRSLLAPG